jgi:hypothetical protein
VLANRDMNLAKVGLTRNSAPDTRAEDYARQHGIAWHVYCQLIAHIDDVLDLLRGQRLRQTERSGALRMRCGHPAVIARGVAVGCGSGKARNADTEGGPQAGRDGTDPRNELLVITRSK